MKRLPITPRSGLILPGIYNFDGKLRVIPVRKERVKELWGIPWEWYVCNWGTEDNPRPAPWWTKIIQHVPRIGLNVYTYSHEKQHQLKYQYRKDCLRILREHFDCRLEQFNHHGIMTDQQELSEENWMLRPRPRHEVMLISIYSRFDSGYVGNPETAWMLYRRGIKPEKAYPDSGSCQIGFCEKEAQWYGWARAFYGFGVGSKVTRGNIGYTPSDPDELLNDIKPYYDHYENTGYEIEENGIRILFDDYDIEYSQDPDSEYGTLIEVNRTFCRREEFVELGRGEWEARTLDDARQMAADFASGCS